MDLFKILGTIALSGAREAQDDIDDTSQKASGFNEKLKDVFATAGKWAAAIGGAALSGGAVVTKMAADFETSMAKVSTIADSSEVSMDSLEKSILDLSNQTGISANDIADNVYNAISAGQSTGDAVNFVTKATQLAKAGFAESADALDILTTVMNAYGLESSAVDDVSNKLIMTQNLGKTTVGELSSAMGKVIPTANSLGVNIDELCASYAVLTSNGIATAETTTYMNSMLNELGKSGTTANDALKAYTEATFGASKSVAELMQEGYNLNDVVGMLASQADKSGKSIADMFGSAEAAKAAQVIASNSDKFTDAIKQMGQSAGATETAFSKMENTLSTKLEKTKTNLKNVGVELGQKLLPIVDKVISAVMKDMPKVQQMIDKIAPSLEKMFETVLPFIVDMLPMIAELADKLLPVIADVLSDIIPVIVEVANQILPIISELIKTILPPLTQIVEAVLPVLTSALQVILPIIEGLLGVLQPILDVVIALLQPILDLVGSGLNALAEAFGFATEKVDAHVAAAKQEVDAMREVKESADRAREAIDAKAEKELSAVTSTEKLWKELQTLTDEEGNVSEADKARAEFITNQLSEALGTEIQWTGNQIDNYKTLQEEIDKTIEKKKAEILLAASEENYKVAIQNRTEAEKQLNQAFSEKEEALNKLHELQAKGMNIDDQEYKNQLAITSAKLDKYREAEEVINGYYSDIAEYETAQTLLLQGETDKAIDLMSKQGQAFVNASDLAAKSSDEKQKILEDQLKDAALKMSNQLELLNGLAEDCTAEERKIYEDAFKKSQEYFENASKEYTKAGGEIGENFFNSMSDRLSTDRFRNIGSYMVEGIANGADSNKSSLFSRLTSIMNQAIERTQAAAEIHSPSRLFARKIGAFIPSGIGQGIEDNEEDAIKPIQDIIADMSDIGFDNTENSNQSAPQAYSMPQGGNSDILSKLDTLIDKISNLRMYLNGDVLVGELAPAINSELGTLSLANERGQ